MTEQPKDYIELDDEIYAGDPSRMLMFAIAGGIWAWLGVYGLLSLLCRMTSVCPLWLSGWLS